MQTVAAITRNWRMLRPRFPAEHKPSFPLSPCLGNRVQVYVVTTKDHSQAMGVLHAQ